MLYETGAYLTFISTEPISSVPKRVSKYGGGKFLEIRLCLATAENPTQKFG